MQSHRSFYNGPIGVHNMYGSIAMGKGRVWNSGDYNKTLKFVIKFKRYGGEVVCLIG